MLDRGVSLLILVTFIQGAPVRAERPCLQVDFEITDAKFGEMMPAEDLDRLVATASDRLVAALNCQVPFLDFTNDGSCATAQKLTFTIERTDAGVPGGSTRAAQIRIGLDTSEGGAAEPVFWPLYENVHSVAMLWDLDSQLSNIDDAFYCTNANAQCPKYDVWIQKQLSRIHVAEGGTFVSNPIFLGWVVPVLQDEHCVTLGTVFDIESELRVNRFEKTKKFQAEANSLAAQELQCEASDSSDRNELLNASEVTVGRIFVKRPQRASLCAARSFPMEVDKCRNASR